MTGDFNLTALYAAAFGYIAKPGYNKLSTQSEVTDAAAFEAERDTEPKPLDTGILGTPIHLPCELGGYKLPNEPLIELSAQKRIVITDIDGNDGSFKELYSNGDMQVTIRGVLVYDDNADEYPEDQVRALRNVLEQRKHVKIVNRLAAMWNVEHVAIESYSFPAVPGELGMQAYEIRCLSDKEFQLRLRE